MPCNWSAIRNSEIAGSNTANEPIKTKKISRTKKNSKYLRTAAECSCTFSHQADYLSLPFFLVFFYHDIEYKYEQWKVKWNWNPINVQQYEHQKDTNWIFYCKLALEVSQWVWRSRQCNSVLHFSVFFTKTCILIPMNSLEQSGRFTFTSATVNNN